MIQEELDHANYPHLRLGNFHLATAKYSPKSRPRKEDEMQINIFSTYLQVYEIFKQWHNGIIAKRSCVPDKSKEEQALD